MKSATFGLAAVLAVGFSNACLADDIVAAERVAGQRLEVLLNEPFANATLSVTGPNGFHASTYSKGGAVAIDLSRLGPLPDGTYNYEVTASSREMISISTPLDNGRRGKPKAEQSVPVSMSGTFLIREGTIVKPKSGKQTSRTDRDAQ
jgi:hypothetical protein